MCITASTTVNIQYTTGIENVLIVFDQSDLSVQQQIWHDI